MNEQEAIDAINQQLSKITITDCLQMEINQTTRFAIKRIDNLVEILNLMKRRLEDGLEIFNSGDAHYLILLEYINKRSALLGALKLVQDPRLEK